MSFHPTMPYGTEQWHRSMRATLPEGPEFAFTPDRRAEFEEFASQYAPEHGARRCCTRSIWCRSSRATSATTRCVTSPR